MKKISSKKNMKNMCFVLFFFSGERLFCKNMQKTRQKNGKTIVAKKKLRLFFPAKEKQHDPFAKHWHV